VVDPIHTIAIARIGTDAPGTGRVQFNQHGLR
jgi:hypothetical protein